MRVKHPIPYVWEDGINGSEEAGGNGAMEYGGGEKKANRTLLGCLQIIVYKGLIL